MPSYLDDNGTLTTYTSSDTKYNYEIKSFRNGLDIKLKNLYDYRDGIMKNQKQQIDSTVYENILLTVLATSILYFTFIKI